MSEALKMKEELSKTVKVLTETMQEHGISDSMILSIYEMMRVKLLIQLEDEEEAKN
jgi:hypothetical protein